MEKAFVFGMARSGYAAAKLLIEKGYQVTINDRSFEQDLEQIKELESLGAKVILGVEDNDLIDNTYEMIVKNPGIPNDHSYLVKAKELGITIINEVELAYHYFPKDLKIIGVTGTNGKTTTSTLIYEMLKQSKKRAYLAGNIGIPVSSMVSLFLPNDIFVIEISDHQLCNMIDFKTDISVLTNISEAHIDFHGSYEKYKEMKKRIFNHHQSSSLAILNLDNEESLLLAEGIPSQKKYFSSNSLNLKGCDLSQGFINYNGKRIIKIDEVKLKGKHNLENIMAAIVAVKEFDVRDEDIQEVLKKFGGVEHRIEFVKTISQVDFYNDSKSTNIKSTQIALSTFDQPTILILGGLDRGHSFDELKTYLTNVKNIVSYGETKDRICSFSKENNIECFAYETIDKAVKKAYDLSESKDVILLSPACASWDQFKDFEERGNKYKETVNLLEEKNE
ncbi:MAG: UDP-N-acetylmuramoyl-L-alanine--D-glutamate ligase [Mollicutes bacterium]|nr:UDP-N-acetylmuramoyl-L-alanine--D-glutamate ligase [Mollicutes bacterium]